jgi:glycerate 2-kinase
MNGWNVNVMSPIIKNTGRLLANASSKRDCAARKLALGCLEAALQAADPRKIMKASIRVRGSRLQVNGKDYDLSKFRRILVVGGGKAGASMSASLEQILGNRITKGYVNVLRGTKLGNRTYKIRLNEASHPIPDEAGLRGTRKMLDIIQDATDRDLVICLLSGGGSALMPYPVPTVSMKDKQLTTQIMLKSGSTINELNCVRKHLSLVKGGGLARAAFPATVLTLILSDVVGDPLDAIASGPTSPDPTTFASAIQILNDRKIWRFVPESVRSALRMGAAGKMPETPKKSDKIFRKVTNIIIGNNRTVCNAAREYAKSIGARTVFLTSLLEGEAKAVGIIVSAFSKELRMKREHSRHPVAFIMGGETTVNVTGSGQGGRNQEMMLSASTKLRGYDGIAITSIGTDGIDGNSPAAGAIVDGHTIQRAEDAAMNATQFLRNNDSYRFFKKLRDVIITGATGTNLNDVTIAAVT